MDELVQTLDQLISELSEAAKHSNALGYEGVSIKLSNQLAVDVVKKLQDCNLIKCNEQKVNKS